MSKNKFNVGDEVVFMNANAHVNAPIWYPEVGTVGFITEVREQRDNDFDIQVQWPEGSTLGTGEWWLCHEWIEPAHPDQGEIEKSDLSISFLLNAEV